MIAIINKRAILILLLLTAPCGAGALEVVLDTVAANTSRGVIRFRLDNKAVFDFDADTEILTSSGTWIAQNIIGPNAYVRYSHKLENFSASAEGWHTVKSYECVEGTFGAALLQANICGNYRFGPNRMDDGGLVDDIAVGSPKSLNHYVVSLFNWDGSNLEIILSPKNLEQREIYTELSIQLSFSVVPETNEEID
jgi:hypothetical protein